MTTLREHLARYGFRDFDSSEFYRFWGGRQLGEDKAKILDRLRKPLEKDDVRPDDVLRFYEFIADPEVAAVVHSMKTDAIRASGEAVWERIKGRKKILDFGCNIGYLSTWYARLGANQVTGVDISARSIEQAKKIAASLGCEGVSFMKGDVRKIFQGAQFDAVVDTQTLYTAPKQRQTLKHLYTLLHDDGIVVTIPPIRTMEKISAYLALLALSGFYIHTLDFIVFSALGEADAYPVIEAGKLPERHTVIDVEAKFHAMQRAVAPGVLPPATLRHPWRALLAA